MLRTLLIVLASALALLLLAVGTVWYFVRDGDFVRRQLEDIVDRETDRTLKIKGPLSVEFGDSIRFSASDITLTDAAWTGRDRMVQVGQLVLRVDGRSLFDDRLEIRELTISDCRLSFRTGEQGERNWELGTGAQKDDSGGGFGQFGKEIPAVLHELNINRCVFSHEAPERAEPLQLEIGELSLQSDPEGQYSGNAHGTVNATPFQFSGRFGPPKSLWQDGEFIEEIDFRSGSWQDLVFSKLTATLGRMEIQGDLKLQQSATPEGRARVSGNIASSFLDLSGWFKGNTGAARDAGAPKAAGSQRRIFDDRPVMGFGKSPIDLDIHLDIAEVDVGTSTLHDVQLHLLWTDEALRLDDVSLRGANGATLNGFFAIDGRESMPRLELKFRGQDLKLGLGALEGQDPSTYPPMELVLDLQGAGKTLHDLAKSLQGRVRIFQGEGLFGSARVEVLFNDFISELFNLLNPFARQSQYTRLHCSVLAADVDGGVMTVTPVVVQTPELTIISQGTIDLATERVDMDFRTRARKGVGISAGTLINPFIKVGGHLSEPSVELDPKGAVISGGAAVATMGLSLVFKSFADRFFSSRDPCGDARTRLAELDAGGPASR